MATQPRAHVPGDADTGDAGMPDELHPRHLLVRVLEIVALIVLVAIGLTALPGLDQVTDRLEDAGPIWIVLLAAAEIGSCLGYMLAFRSTFCPTMSWSLTYDIAMSEQAANSLLPSGGAGGLALGVWALRQAGMPTAHVARRTVAFFVVTSAANFVFVVLAGLGVFVGLLPGRGSPVFTLVPALIAAAAIVLAILSPRMLRALGRGADDDAPTWIGRGRRLLRSGLIATADGTEQAVGLLQSHSFGVIVGSLAYMGFDIAALGAGFVAVGHLPPVGTLLLGYLIGQLGNLLPLPGGVGGTEGGLVGMFAIYHVNVSEAAAAVLLYRLFQLAVPALLGAPAFALLRRRLMRADKPATVCAPLAADVVDLPARG